MITEAKSHEAAVINSLLEVGRPEAAWTAANESFSRGELTQEQLAEVELAVERSHQPTRRMRRPRSLQSRPCVDLSNAPTRRMRRLCAR